MHLHPDMGTYTRCKSVDPAEEAQAKGLADALDIIFSPREELTPSRDERHFDDVLYWLEKARDAVSEVGKNYWRTPTGTDEAMDALLDAESAVEDRIYEYRQAWEAARGHEAAAYGEDSYNGGPEGR